MRRHICDIMDAALEASPAQKREVGARILTRRKAFGWSQRRLSREARIDSSRLSRIERGLVLPSLVEIGRLRESLHASCDELLFGGSPGPLGQQQAFLQRVLYLLELGLAAEGESTREAQP